MTPYEQRKLRRLWKARLPAALWAGIQSFARSRSRDAEKMRMKTALIRTLRDDYGVSYPTLAILLHRHHSTLVKAYRVDRCDPSPENSTR